MRPLGLILTNFMMMVLFYGMTRLLFLITNFDQFSHYGIIKILAAFIYGMRFDVAAILMINIPLLPLLFAKSRNIKAACLWGFVLINGAFLSLNFVDTEYFRFTGKRMTFSSFSIANDIIKQLPGLVVEFWWLSVVLIGALVAMIWPSLWAEKMALRARGLQRSTIAVVSALLLVLAFLGVRGGTQAKPLNLAHAYMGFDGNLPNLVLNSPFCVLKTYNNERISRKAYFADWQSLYPYLDLQRPIDDSSHQAMLAGNSKTMDDSSNQAMLAGNSKAIDDSSNQTMLAGISKTIDGIAKAKKNVIIIILESFNLEYMGRFAGGVNYTPFLNKIADDGVFFEKNLANGRRSIDALPAILAGLPALMDQPFITSEYQTSEVQGLASCLRDVGYATSFFHGAHDGSMFFDILAERLGFSSYHGANGFPDQSQDDGRWGIYDEPFFEHAVSVISEEPQPFFSTLFSISSHHPYKIPAKYKNRFAKGTLPIHESIMYTDHALKGFFEKARGKPWYKDTVFIITADHTAQSEHRRFKNVIGQYRVPLIFYPRSEIPDLGGGDIDFPTQHVDIMPSVLELLGQVNCQRLRFGSSVLAVARREVKPSATIMASGKYFRLEREHFLNMDTGGTISAYKWLDDDWENWQLIEDGLEDDSQKRLKATVQYYYNGLLENRLNL